MGNVEEHEDPWEDDEDRQGARLPLASLALNSSSKYIKIYQNISKYIKLKKNHSDFTTYNHR